MAIEFAAQGQVRSTLGESPVYDARRNALWYCDITEHAVRRFDLGNAETRSWTFPTDVGSLGLTESGRVVIARREEVGIWNPDAIEKQLAHLDTSMVRRAYTRGEYWDERVRMMQHWSDYLDQLRDGAKILRPQFGRGREKGA